MSEKQRRSLKRWVAMCTTALGLMAAAVVVLPATNAVGAAQPGAIFSAVQAIPNDPGNVNANGAANVDPIVAPGPVGTQSAHPHVFCGASGVSSASTAASMLAGGTTFAEGGVHSGAWTPEIKYDGVPLELTGDTSPGGSDPMKDCLLYYREVGNVTGDGIPNSQGVVTGNQGIPFGLKMVLKPGTYNGKVVNLGDELIYKCGPGSTTDLAAPPASCPSSNPLLSVSARFPHCWDGANLDTVQPNGMPAVNPVTLQVYPNDHISHMQYGPCDSDHPIEIIRVEQFFRFYYGTSTHDISKLTFGGFSWDTFHTDYMFSWADEAMEDFMSKCIDANVACSNNVVAEGGLRDGPGGGGATGPTGQTGPPTDTKPIVTGSGTVVGVDSAGGTTLTVNPAASHMSGNFEVLACESADQAVTLGTANGFAAQGSAVGAGTGTAATRITLFSRTWNGTSGSPVVNRGSNDHVICNITSFDHGTVSATQTSSEATEDTSGSATLPTGSDGLFVLFAANGKPNSNQANQVTPGGSETELTDQANTAGNGGLIYVATDAATRTTAFTYTTVSATAKAHILLRLT